MNWRSPKTWALALAAWEGGWWLRRNAKRKSVFAEAAADAKASGRKFIVVGAPDMGATMGPGCGDVTIDIGTSSCSNFLQADITKPLPFADDSATIFVSCVLEYVDDYEAAMKELRRVAGNHLFAVYVEPWTLTAYLYPGTKRQLNLTSGKVS